MRFKRPVLRFLIDEGVPDGVGHVLERRKHKVVYVNKGVVPRGSSDQIVAAFAQINNYILVATDGDMKEIAKSIGLQNRQYSQLSLLKLTVEEWKAADRVESAMTLIEHEWHYSQSPEGARRIFIEIRTQAINLRR